MTSDIRVHSRHAWSLMNEEDLTHKLHKLGLILNRPEPALICRQCKYALQPSGTRVSKHLAEKHAIPASERKELASYIDSLRLPNPNLLSGRRNGSEPHQRVSLYVSMQSWTQNGARAYWAVNVKPEVFTHVSDGMTTRSPRQMRRLEALHEEERKRMKQDKEGYDVLDTGAYDESFVGNWMRRTDWAAMFSGVNRRLLVRLTEAPAIHGSALVYGVHDGIHLQSCAEDEQRIRMIGIAMDQFFERCEDTVCHTGHSIRC
jgi:hypothetical protein